MQHYFSKALGLQCIESLNLPSTSIYIHYKHRHIYIYTKQINKIQFDSPQASVKRARIANWYTAARTAAPAIILCDAHVLTTTVHRINATTQHLEATTPSIFYPNHTGECIPHTHTHFCRITKRLSLSAYLSYGAAQRACNITSDLYFIQKLFLLSHVPYGKCMA